MIGKYKIITLCGSTRFKDEFLEAQKRLTLEGCGLGGPSPLLRPITTCA
jgi:hypothetical protein